MEQKYSKELSKYISCRDYHLPEECSTIPIPTHGQKVRFVHDTDSAGYSDRSGGWLYCRAVILCRIADMGAIA